MIQMDAKTQIEEGENGTEKFPTANQINEEEEEEMEKEKDADDEEAETTRENGREIEVAPALIALHPLNRSIAVAVGSDLRIFDFQRECAPSLAEGSKELLHKGSIRAVRFSPRGTLLVSAGDDKLVKIWSADTWKCLSTVNSEKRVTAVAISKDEEFVCFADKFGVVWVVKPDVGLENQASSNKKAVPLLAHYCSIITSLEFSPDGRFIVSGDRDFKIRVTVFPSNPLNGAHEIQTFCLGHSEFVSCLAFVENVDYPQGFLLSGSGDSTVRMWDVMSGSLLCSCDVRAEAGVLNESHPAITDLCATPDGSVVAVAIQSVQGILTLSCDLSAKAISVLKMVLFSGDVFIPTSLAVGGLLWMVTGVSNLPGFKASSLARVKVIAGFQDLVTGTANGDLAVLDDGKIPGGEQLLEKLQSCVSIESDVLSAAADAVRGAMSNLLIKKQYNGEDGREFRKRRRNDKKRK